MNPLKVSIIVPNYNHELFLPQRLESIFAQTYQAIEVILLDDASKDSSLSLLKQYENHPKVVQLICNQENSGSPFKQWKKGMEVATGDFIWIAESDDYCEPNFLEELIRLNLENDNSLDIIYSQSLDIDAEGNEVSNRLEYTANYEPNIWSGDFTIDGVGFIRKYLKEKCVIPNASAVIFRRSLLEVEPLTQDHLQMKICGDWFFWLKLAKDSTIGFVGEPLNYFRFHPNVTRIQSNYNKVYLRCSEEKKIRTYLNKHYTLDQRDEVKILYKKWFKVNRFSKLFTKQFYHVKMKETSVFTYIKMYLKLHNTKDKLVKKLKR